jgi:hypothetical protein
MLAGPVLLIERSALALTLAAVLLLLLLKFGSVVPAGALMTAELTNVPVALALTVPLILIVTEAPEGSVGMLPVTLLPLTSVEAGQTAPPSADPQVAVNPIGVMPIGSVSLNVVPLALLGPALLITNE